MIMKRILKDLAARVVALILPQVASNKYFSLWESKGYHITPNHFYQPIPDTRTLKDDLWSRRSELIGIDMNTEKQLKLLNLIFPKFKDEYNFPEVETAIPYEFYLKNGAFESVDPEVLHCMIRHFKPKSIIEIGSGASTYLAAKACLINKEKDGVNTKLFAIDPYPNVTIKKGFQGLSGLIQKRVEDVEMDFFLQLEENDILFIDSSHVIHIGSDVIYEYLEIIPRLKEGVIIHSHDIFLPAEYPKDWVLRKHRFWNEQYLLQALLTYNHVFEVLWAGNYMHSNYPNELKLGFPSYAKKTTDSTAWVGPGSFWIRKKAQQVITTHSSMFTGNMSDIQQMRGNIYE